MQGRIHNAAEEPPALAANVEILAIDLARRQAFATRRAGCAKKVRDLLDRFHKSKMPAEEEARRRLIVLCAFCGKCRIEPS